MGLFDRWSRRAAIPVEFKDANSVFLADSLSGEKITTAGSVELVPVWAAVQLVAGAVGSLPLRVFQTTADGQRVESPNHRAAKLLASPNPVMHGGALWEVVMCHLLLWGNAFLLKNRDANGNVIELWPFDPAKVKVTTSKDGYPLYKVGDQGPFTSSTFIHFRGLSFDGAVGLSPIQMARNTLGLYTSVEKYQSRFWKNNATPGGVLTHPNRLSSDAAERLRAQWQASHSGDNANRVAILEEGMKFDPMSLPMNDAELIKSLELSTLNVARLFQIPASMMQTNANGSSLTYTSTEMEYSHFVRFCLRRWLSKLEGTLLHDADVFLNNGLGAQFSSSFDTTDLTRGDTKTIADINIALYAAGVVTRDEVRAELGRGPIDLTADAPVDAVAPANPAASVA